MRQKLLGKKFLLNFCFCNLWPWSQKVYLQNKEAFSFEKIPRFSRKIYEIAIAIANICSAKLFFWKKILCKKLRTFNFRFEHFSGESSWKVRFIKWLSIIVGLHWNSFLSYGMKWKLKVFKEKCILMGFVICYIRHIFLCAFLLCAPNAICAKINTNKVIQIYQKNPN